MNMKSLTPEYLREAEYTRTLMWAVGALTEVFREPYGFAPTSVSATLCKTFQRNSSKSVRDLFAGRNHFSARHYAFDAWFGRCADSRTGHGNHYRERPCRDHHRGRQHHRFDGRRHQCEQRHRRDAGHRQLGGSVSRLDCFPGRQRQCVAGQWRHDQRAERRPEHPDGGRPRRACQRGCEHVTLNGTSITTTGVGAALAAIGGTINASTTVVNNTATAGSTISAGHGAIAESGGTILLHAGTSITTAAFNSVGLGASGANSRVVPDVLIPVTMNGRGAMGIYVHDGGQVTLLPGSTLQMNGTSSVGIGVDNTTVALGTIGSGLTINFNAVGVAGQAGGTGLFAVNGGSLAIANVTVTGTNAAAGAWATASRSRVKASSTSIPPRIRPPTSSKRRTSSRRAAPWRQASAWSVRYR